MCTEQVELQSQRFLLVVIGPPGAGKTVFAHEFVKRINSCQIVSKDGITNRYCGTPVDEADYFERFRGPIYKQVDREIDYLLPYGPVVVDVTHRLERTNEGWLKFTRDWLTNISKLPADCGLRINNSGHPSEAVDIALTFMRERFASLSQARLVLNYA